LISAHIGGWGFTVVVALPVEEEITGVSDSVLYLLVWLRTTNDTNDAEELRS
jgi:hypothetical protein